MQRAVAHCHLMVVGGHVNSRGPEVVASDQKTENSGLDFGLLVGILWWRLCMCHTTIPSHPVTHLGLQTVDHTLLPLAPHPPHLGG